MPIHMSIHMSRRTAVVAAAAVVATAYFGFLMLFLLWNNVRFDPYKNKTRNEIHTKPIYVRPLQNPSIDMSIQMSVHVSVHMPKLI